MERHPLKSGDKIFMDEYEIGVSVVGADVQPRYDATPAMGSGLGSGLGAELEITHLELGALGLEPLHVGGGGAQRLALRQQEIAGIAVAHADDLAHLAELGDPLEKDHFHRNSP